MIIVNLKIYKHKDFPLRLDNSLMKCQYDYVKYLAEKDEVILVGKYHDEVSKLFGMEVLEKIPRKDINNSLILNYDVGNTLELAKELSVVGFVFPKIVNSFLGSFKEKVSQIELYSSILGMTLYPTIFNSMSSLEQFKELQSKVLSYGLISKSHLSAIPIGVDIEKLSQYQSAKNNVFIYPGNQIITEKNFEDVIKAFDYLYALGLDFKLKMFVYSQYWEKIPKRDYIEVNESLPQEEFWNEASKCGAFLSMSKSESYGLAYLELIKIGLVGIFKDEQWVRFIYGNYPYVGKSIEEVVLLLKSYLENKLKPISSFVDSHDKKLFIKNYYDKLNEFYLLQFGK